MRTAQIFVAIVLFAIAIIPAIHAFAGPPSLVDPNTGKYLGDLSANPYAPNSTSNPYGQYGSRYSPDSINNPYGQYGSPYSSDSANNPYATGAPVIVPPIVPTMPGLRMLP